MIADSCARRSREGRKISGHLNSDNETRAVIPLLIDMAVAVVSTKLPILLGHGFGPFAGPKSLPYMGFWGMLHEARTDFSMIFGLVFLLTVGAGRWSLDAKFRTKLGRPQEMHSDSAVSG